jgi:hypothetical protein
MNMIDVVEAQYQDAAAIAAIQTQDWPTRVGEVAGD